MMEERSVWDSFNPDIFLACLVPLSILVCLRLFPSTRLADFRNLLSLKKPATIPGPLSLQTALKSYASYSSLAQNELSQMRRSYESLLRVHKRMAYDLGYPRKLDKVQDSTNVNAIITHAIEDLTRQEYAYDLDEGSLGGLNGNVGRVRESLKHFLRDWSEEGRTERDIMFKPILDVFREVPEVERSGHTVLVPGCGLGRLAWDISQLGFDTTANELSYFMILALRFLLSPSTTSTLNEHTIRPFCHWFSHQRSRDSLFRPIHFPDVIPRLGTNFRLAEADFLLLKSPSSGYHYITTLFFIDTSLNVVQTIEHIYSLLRPGGIWINLGPLLWTAGAQAKVELSLEEVLRLSEAIGFVFDTRDGDPSKKSRTVNCEYTADQAAMMQWIYNAEFWVARKPK